MNSFFKDLKVVELASVLAGPAAGMFFAELGAKVIKIENKATNGDVTRSWKIATEKKESSMSSYFASVNWNKQSVFLDLKKETDRQQVYNQIKDADIIISNYKTGDDVKLKMDYDTLKKINTTIIYAHLTGFGNNSTRTAYDLVLQAETGFMHMNGTAQSGPLKMPVALIDVMAAHQLKEAILIAIIKKLKSGKGSKISVSLFDSAIASLTNQASSFLMTGNNPKAMGSLHPSIAPYGETFTTNDNKHIVLAIGSQKQFEQLCKIIGQDALPVHPKFSTNADRVINRQALFELLQFSIKNLDSGTLMQQFIKQDVPAGLIKTVKEVFETNNLETAILSEKVDETTTKRLKTVAFSITD